MYRFGGAVLAFVALQDAAAVGVGIKDEKLIREAVALAVSAEGVLSRVGQATGLSESAAVVKGPITAVPHDVEITSTAPVPDVVGVAGSGFDWQLHKNFPDAVSSAFSMIMATELGDETFIIAAVMAMRHPKYIILGGALSALYLMTVLSAALGLVLPNLISERMIHSCATLLYTLFGLRLIWIGAMGEEEDKDKEFEEVENQLKEGSTKEQQSVVALAFARCCTPVFIEAFILIFLAEWGDRSQIATITLASHLNPLGVTVGAVVGHSICTGLAVLCGEYLGKRISQRVVAFTGGFLFLAFAVTNYFFGSAGVAA